MIVVRLKGGMGNQMFQYAFGKRIARQLNTDLVLDLTVLLDRSKKGKDFVYRDYDLDVFKVDPKFTLQPGLLRTLFQVRSSRMFKILNHLSIGKLEYIKEPHFHVAENLMTSPKDHAVYDGWWQSWRYFESIKTELKAEFSFRRDPLEIANPLYEQISKTNAVCINVRRTDFLKVSELNTTNQDYFLNGVNYLAEHLEEPHFYIFSDDVAWCRENLKLQYPYTVVDHSYKGYKFGNYQQLMASCKHFIIPNSSFAWWAVWMSDYPGKTVIAPKHWFNSSEHDTSDLVPKDWIRL